MFENEKIYITEIKTVSLNENNAGKKTYFSPGVFFGMSASVYGKMINCYFGGSFSRKGYAVSQEGKSSGPSECYYDVSCNSYEISTAKRVDGKSEAAVMLLNEGIKNVKGLPEGIKLLRWKKGKNHPGFIKNDNACYVEKGDGTKEKPYIIRTADDFIEFTNNLNNQITFKNKYFLQVSDIDLSTRSDYMGANGARKPYVFQGVYDGGGHEINISLEIADKNYNNTVFPNTEGVIVNLGITGTVLSDSQYVSGFVRSVKNNGIVANCYSLVSISDRRRLESCYELRYNLSGKSKIYFDGCFYDVKEGSVLYIPKKNSAVSFFEETIVPCKSVSVFFDTQFLLSDEMFVCDMSASREIEVLFSKMYSSWLSRKSKYYLECMSLIYEIISKLSKPKGNYLSNDKYKLISKGVSYLYENCFNKDIDVYYPAKLCGISYTYFKQLFVQKFDRPPKQQIMYLRMERAAELLKTTDCTITQIAERCGFDNVYYFSTAFKKYFGVSPKNYNR